MNFSWVRKGVQGVMKKLEGVGISLDWVLKNWMLLHLFRTRATKLLCLWVDQHQMLSVDEQDYRKVTYHVYKAFQGLWRLC